MQKNNKILIIGPAWIGDMVMSQTLFKLLKQQADCEIHVLAPPWTASLCERMPEVTGILIAPFKHGELKLWQRYKFAKSLRSQHFDQAIVLPNSFKSALIPFWAHIPKRTGWKGEQRYVLLNDIRKLDKQKLPLMIQRFDALGLDAQEPVPDKLPRPQLLHQPSQQRTLPQKPILALCPGAEYGPAKRWPAEHFAELAKAKLAQGWQVELFGGKNDQAITAEIQRLTNNKCIDWAGKTSILEAIDLLGEATAVVSNDTGLMHIAAALNKKLVVIYGSSSPKFTPPLSNQAKILSLNLECSPCFERECPLKHLKCLRNLTPDMVLNALDKI